MIVQVAFDLPARKLFDYLVAENQPMPPVGARVIAPFGATSRVGIVLQTASCSEIPLPQLRQIEKQLDSPALPEPLVLLLLQAAERWLLPIGKLAFAAYPPLLRKAKTTPQSVTAERTKAPADLAGAKRLSPAPSLAPALGALEASWGKFALQLIADTSFQSTQKLVLTALQRCIGRGQTALLLVPEIRDTAHWQKHLCAKLPSCSIVTLHSSSTPKQRVIDWLNTQAGCHHVVIGTRQAVLYPVAELGLIVVINENDPLYRAERGIAFPARDAAALRAKTQSCPLLMTATVPSLELYHAAQNKRLQLSVVAPPPTATRPQVEVVDISNRRLFGGISVEMENALRRELRRNGLSVVLINRRGHGNMLYCEECRQLLRCSRCMRKLAQRNADECYCNFCGKTSNMPSLCPSCGGPRPEAVRPGSMRIASTLAARFPDANILRIDADATPDEIANGLKGNVDIVVGTRALLGHNLQPGTCVLSDADSMLSAPSFKAAELLLDTLTRLAGYPSVTHLTVQTRQSNHHVFAALQSGDYRDFAQTELKDCKAAGLPPFRRFALLSATHAKAAELARCIGAARLLFQQALQRGVTLFEPVETTSGSKLSMHKMQLLISAADRRSLHQTLKQALVLLNEHHFPSGFAWELRVDPEKW